jgi:ribosomal protein S8
MLRDLNTTLNTLRLSTARKRLRSVVLVDVVDLPLIHALHRAGFIRSIRILRSTGGLRIRLQITLHFFRNAPFWHISRLVTRRSRQIFIQFKSLQLLSSKIGASSILLLTTKGVMLAHEALSLREGGVVLFFLI